MTAIASTIFNIYFVTLITKNVVFLELILFLHHAYAPETLILRAQNKNLYCIFFSSTLN